MGSSGSGSLSDYPGSKKRGKKSGRSGGGGGGGAASEDRCNKAFNVTLEDVEHCAFFKSNGSSPKTGAELHIAHRKRLVAQTPAGVVVGNLPTKLNYLAACLADGFKYVGKVVASGGSSVAKVAVDFAPVPPK